MHCVYGAYSCNVEFTQRYIELFLSLLQFTYILYECGSKDSIIFNILSLKITIRQNFKDGQEILRSSNGKEDWTMQLKLVFVTKSENSWISQEKNFTVTVGNENSV